MQAALAPQTSPSPWSGLRSVSQADVRLWNWFNRVFGQPQSWRGCINDALAPLLECPAGSEIILQRASAVPGQEQDKKYRFSASEISFGRDPGNDVLLTPRSIAGKHARIARDGMGYVLEDLGSPLGIYLNKRKMKSLEKAAISKGDQISIFPYRFTFDVETKWGPETNIETHAFGPDSCNWASFNRNRPLDAVGFLISAHPTNHAAYLETSRLFLEQVLHRFLRPLGVNETVSRSFAAQAGVTDFLILATIERLNNLAPFPFRWSVCCNTGEAGFGAGEDGLQLRYSIGLSRCSGSFRIFLPGEMMKAMTAVFPGASPRHDIETSWTFPITLGHADFTTREVRAIEAGDVILFEASPAMFISADARRGWKLTAIDDNACRFRVDKYFERTDMSEINAIEPMGPTRMELDDLPVRLDVVVGEREFTLREIQDLAEGSILELNRAKEEPVRVKLNGRLAADGELLEIDGRLGVRIMTWRHAS